MTDQIKDNQTEKQKDVTRVHVPEVQSNYGLRRRREADRIVHDSKISQTWLISFTDVIALMLTFFIMLFSMTEPVEETWSQVTSTLKSEFNKFYGASFYTGTTEAVTPELVTYDKALNVNYLEELFETMKKDTKGYEGVDFEVKDGRLIITLPEDLMFAEGDIVLKEGGRDVIYTLAGSLSRLKNNIEVIGRGKFFSHVQAEDLQYSAWEKPLLWAQAVAFLLQETGYEKNIAIKSTVEEPAFKEDIKGVIHIIVLDHEGKRKKAF